MKNKSSGFYIKLNEEEKAIITNLKTKYAVNISQLFKVFIRNYSSLIGSVHEKSLSLKR